MSLKIYTLSHGINGGLLPTGISITHPEENYAQRTRVDQWYRVTVECVLACRGRPGLAANDRQRILINHSSISIVQVNRVVSANVCVGSNQTCVQPEGAVELIYTAVVGACFMGLLGAVLRSEIFVDAHGGGNHPFME